MKPIPTKVTISKTDISDLKGFEERLAEAVRYPTVSYEDTSMIDYESFVDFHRFLLEAFPSVFENVSVDTINKYSLLLKWSGSNKDLKPGIFMAHQDVVPVSDDTRDLWKHPPFSGTIINDTLYGRGSIDDKVNLIAQLEAADFLIKQGFKPERDLYFAFGHDEEIGGLDGALVIAQLLKERQVQADFVIDEGGYVATGMVPGVDKSVALVGTSEKGFLNLELSVNIDGGHSSMPDKNNAIDVMSKALTNLHNSPFSPSISQSVQDFFRYIAPHSSFVNKMAMSNPWLFKSLIYKSYGKTGAGAAMIHTTMVPTIIHGGEKDNVIPNIVTANVNYRITPGMTIDEVVAHTRKAIKNPDIDIKIKDGAREATPVSPVNTRCFDMIAASVEANFEGSITTPFLMIAGTDSKHFNIISDNIYKFSPMKNPIGFHGVNEQLYLKDYAKTIGFYIDFIKNLDR